MGRTQKIDLEIDFQARLDYVGKPNPFPACRLLLHCIAMPKIPANKN